MYVNTSFASAVIWYQKKCT